MIRTATEYDGALLRVTLASPPGNIVDLAMMRELIDALAGLHAPDRTKGKPQTPLRAVLLDHDGPNFSFGASVQEHLPDTVREMITTFGRLIRALVHAPVPVLAAVDGRCLGGGFELALAAQFRFARDDALLGVPEVTLGVFPPAAAALLPWRAPMLARMVMTGEVLGATRLAEGGLVDEVTEDSAARGALEFFEKFFLPRSAFAVRHATRACDPGSAFDDRLAAAERQYLEELSAGHDPLEGLQAFLDRRKPIWTHG